MENYNGFNLKRDNLFGREVIIVFPKDGTANGKWVLKTEYFDAFPDAQIKLLEQGYHLAHIVNRTRWYVPEDTEKRKELALYMHHELGLSEKCAIIGMSCGGMQGIYFASEYPELVACLYLDAPVVNLLSCPAGVGGSDKSMFDEFREHTGMELADLIAYRNHPLDRLPKLAENNIPILLICGDSDDVVPYEQNGRYIKEEYEKNNCIIETIIKPGCGHHPHGLENSNIVADFINKYYI